MKKSILPILFANIQYEIMKARKTETTLPFLLGKIANNDCLTTKDSQKLKLYPEDFVLMSLKSILILWEVTIIFSYSE